MNAKLLKCNKLFALYTQEEKDQMKSIIAKFATSMKEVERELTDHLNPPEGFNRWESIASPFQQRLEILHDAVKTRYILAFNGEETAILADVQEILNVIDKKDFKKEIKIRKSLVFNEDFLLHRAEKIADPIKREETINNIPAFMKSRKQAAIANYWNCYNFLLSQLTDQIEALQYYGLPLSGLEELTAAKASEWYKKPKSKSKGSTTHIEKAAEQAKKLFYTMPTSSASHLLLDILSSGDSIADLPARKKQVSHGTTYEVKASGDKRLVSMENYKGTAKVTVELADIEKIMGSNKPAKKLLVLSLIKANEQAVHNGQLTKEYISFPLQELLDIGFYKTPQSARKGFYSGADPLTSLKIKGKVKKSKKKVEEIGALEVLFTGARIERGQCFIFFNPRISWGFLTQYFTILPRYYFRLPNRASDLLYYIFFLARQHTKDIKERGYFTISFRAIQNKLQLPNENGLNNPQRDIKDAIEDAIEQLEDEHSQTYGNMEFSLHPVYDEEAPISEYLDNGYLKVELKGDFVSSFIAISQETEKQIEQTQKRQARIQERAIVQATAKKLESKTEQGESGDK